MVKKGTVFLRSFFFRSKETKLGPLNPFLCMWCGYINERKLVENDYNNNYSTCPCCNLDVVEIN